MSDKQLTGTITLPGVDPDLYELTGEFRKPCCGDWFVTSTGSICSCTQSGVIEGRIILRRKPRRIRVTPTQADLDAATEPIPCWVRDTSDEDWYRRKLRAIDKFTMSFLDEGYGDWKQCEIEKEVTE